MDLKAERYQQKYQEMWNIKTKQNKNKGISKHCHYFQN